MLKIAVVGTGFIGSVHAKNVARHPGAELVAVYDANLEAAKRIGGTTTGAKAVADVAEIFGNPEVQAVAVEAIAPCAGGVGVAGKRPGHGEPAPPSTGPDRPHHAQPRSPRAMASGPAAASEAARAGGQRRASRRRLSGVKGQPAERFNSKL